MRLGAGKVLQGTFAFFPGKAKLRKSLKHGAKGYFSLRKMHVAILSGPFFLSTLGLLCLNCSNSGIAIDPVMNGRLKPWNPVNL